MSIQSNAMFYKFAKIIALADVLTPTTIVETQRAIREDTSRDPHCHCLMISAKVSL